MIKSPRQKSPENMNYAPKQGRLLFHLNIQTRQSFYKGSYLKPWISKGRYFRNQMFYFVIYLSIATIEIDFDFLSVLTRMVSQY